jgi:hypothetical protein
MEVGIYFHDNLGVAMHAEEDFRGRGIPVQTHEECLCRMNGNMTKLEKYILFHPGDTEECWNKAKQVIMASHSSEFYIIAFGRPARREGIGEHENVIYLDFGGFKEFRHQMHKNFGLQVPE